MELRALGATDGLAYREVRLRALRDAPEAFGSTFAEESVHDEAFWIDLVGRTAEAMEAELLAIDRGDGTLAGTTFVRVSPEPPHDGYVGAMWVDADLRGGDWASALLDEAERFARRLGSEAMTLWVSQGNAPARRFYERQGYKSTGTAELQPSGIVAELWMKPLP
jgi:ribosomal protein S18 acetylase RimI-like enzyme